MPHKPNKSWSLPELKTYVRDNKLADKEIRLGMKKAEMVMALKKKGHWDDADVKRKKVPMGKLKKTYLPSETATAIMHQVLEDQVNLTANKPMVSPAQSELQNMLASMGSFTIDDEISNMVGSLPVVASMGSLPKRATVGTTTTALLNMPMDIGGMISKAAIKRFSDNAEGENIKVGKGDPEDTSIGYIDETSGLVEINYGYDIAATTPYTRIKKNKSGVYTVKKGDLKFLKDEDGSSYRSYF